MQTSTCAAHGIFFKARRPFHIFRAAPHHSDSRNPIETSQFLPESTQNETEGLRDFTSAGEKESIMDPTLSQPYPLAWRATVMEGLNEERNDSLGR